MIRIFVYLMLLAFFGCAQIGPCDYSLSEHGWKPSNKLPSGLVDIYNKKTKWFLNDSGDYLSCPRMTGKNHCAGIYTIYKDGKNDPEGDPVFMCMT